MEARARWERSLGAASAIAVGLGAFLLFQVQPMAAKKLLPALGGSAGVWTTCMLFFQGGLLAAYAYAHALTRIRRRVAAVIHAVVIALALTQLPIRMDVGDIGASAPLLHILFALARGIGLPYFALATTTPLMEAFVSGRRRVLFRLFAISNAGSLIALGTYPILVEPFIRLNTQLRVWSGAACVYAALVAAVLVATARENTGPPRPAAHEADANAGPNAALMWIALSAVASLLLLTTTTQLSTCIAPIPLLWIVPLAVYLTSFIVTFAFPGTYPRKLMLACAALAVAILGTDISLWEIAPVYKIALVTASLFAACTAAHGELARMRPSHALTRYYLCISLGGALGGGIAAWAAPRIFNVAAERPLAAIVLGALLIARLVRDPGAADAAGAPPRTAPLHVILGLALVFIAALSTSGRSVVSERNFYGTIRVVDATEPYGRERRMVHGGIIHGVESLDPLRQGEPMSYFTPASGLARAIAQTQRSGPIHFGVVGLGIGSALEFLTPADHARIYELDPLVVKMASEHFTITTRHAAQSTIVVGDGRAALGAEPPQEFDVLALDAFSGDAVPVHMLSLEALRMFARHVSARGFLCVHITNLYLDLQPVVHAGAQAIGWHARSVVSPANARGGKKSHWILLHRDDSVLDDPLFDAATKMTDPPALAPWTDDFTSVWPLIRKPHGL